VVELAGAAGSLGVIGGQVEDLAAEGEPPSRDRVEFIHAHKTGDLIRAAVRLGAIAAGAAADDLDGLTRYAERLGKTFQITDDILNATSTAEVLGKPAGTDARRGKMTYVAVAGLDAARSEAATLARDAVEALRGVKGFTSPLSALAEHTVNRSR